MAVQKRRKRGIPERRWMVAETEDMREAGVKKENAWTRTK